MVSSLSSIMRLIFWTSILASAVDVASSAPSQPNVENLNCWKQLAPIKGGPRQEHGVAATGSKVYVIGGLVQCQSMSLCVANTAEVYNVEDNKWSDVKALPLAIHHPNVAAVDGKIYVLGGLTGLLSWKASPNSYVYDPAVNMWDQLATMPAGTERGSAAVGVIGKTIYMAGGLNGISPTVDTATSYDTASGKWATLPKLPEAKDHGGGAVVGDTFYAVGGRTAGIASLRSTVYSLNATATAWKKETSMRVARGGISVAAAHGKVYAFGGEGNPAAGSRGVFPNIESYDVQTGLWAEEPPMMTPRHGTGAASVGDTIYIPGGGIVQSGGQVSDLHDAFGLTLC
jgi:N-acetylneuraminic acid mutarotase